MITMVFLPLLGGILIGLAASAFLFFNGRIAGISGIVGGALTDSPRDGYWRYWFVAGLVIGGFFLWQVMPSAFPSPTSVRHQSLFRLIVAGGLVGFGTRLGSGCTSGHGVCGIGRLSPRSSVATVTFIAVGAFVVLVLRLFGAQ